jgi:hypothetical protein
MDSLGTEEGIFGEDMVVFGEDMAAFGEDTAVPAEFALAVMNISYRDPSDPFSNMLSASTRTNCAPSGSVSRRW